MSTSKRGWCESTTLQCLSTLTFVLLRIIPPSIIFLSLLYLLMSVQSSRHDSQELFPDFPFVLWIFNFTWHRRETRKLSQLRVYLSARSSELLPGALCASSLYIYMYIIPKHPSLRFASLSIRVMRVWRMGETCKIEGTYIRIYKVISRDILYYCCIRGDRSKQYLHYLIYYIYTRKIVCCVCVLYIVCRSRARQRWNISN